MKLVQGRADIDDLDAFLDGLGEIGDEFDCAIQALDADYVVGSAHLQTAVDHADRAFERGENVARERPVEILLYAAGRRQIDRALRMGVGEGESDVVVVIHSPEGDADDEQAAAENMRDLLMPAPEGAGASSDEASSDEDEAESMLAPDRIDREAVMEFFDVTDAELSATDATLADLVLERVALLDVEK